jgi:hypothetical protein
VTATEARPIAACSFCLKPHTEVAKLVAGPGVFICDECVGLCNQIIADKQHVPVEPVGGWEQKLSDDDLLSHLPKVAAASAQAQEQLTVWVRQARSRGITWTRIGESLGITRQSAWERFSGED